MSTTATDDGSWFRALLDSATDVYFRYALTPVPRFAYLSPSIRTLTGRSPEEFHNNPALCFTLIGRDERRLLRQILRARRPVTAVAHLTTSDGVRALEIRTAPVVRQHRVVAIEGVARMAPAPAQSTAVVDEPVQQRLTALMCQVHDLLHRVLPVADTARAAVENVLLVGSLRLDVDRLSVTEDDQPVALTSREVMVLRYLLRHANRIVTRQQLLTEVWGHVYTGDDRTVDVHISRLRRKLPSLRARLVAVKHVGYRLDRGEGELTTSPRLPRVRLGAI